MPRRLSLTITRDHALQATRVSIGKSKLVYLLITDKRLKYKEGKSRIAYIGTTKKGVARMAQSIAARADDILSLRGVRTFHARVVTCKPRKRISTWEKLECALLLKFKERFGEAPKCNSHGKRMKVSNEFRYFSPVGVSNVVPIGLTPNAPIDSMATWAGPIFPSP